VTIGGKALPPKFAEITESRREKLSEFYSAFEEVIAQAIRPEHDCMFTIRIDDDNVKACANPPEGFSGDNNF